MVDLLSFKTNLDQTLSEAVLGIEENEGHILVETVPTSLVKMVNHPS